MKNQGLTLLEVLISLAILALASSLVMISISSVKVSNDWPKIGRFVEQAIQQSFYQQTPLRIVCEGSMLQLQNHQATELYDTPERHRENRQWLPIGSPLKISTELCLYHSQSAKCQPCPTHTQGNNQFQLLFNDGLAQDSYQLRERPSTIAEHKESATGLLIHSHGIIEELPLRP
ncbi:prepilin-type N-terminal cleavage/methylation domain-containing protein [uncultured Pseudoteredinibacter sp.]|uniref:type II secretion system protein n=1 Tax=uncultured Pseudoteredinibacter sp. TaxID=1641701 RepID=UPI002620C13C|nr:prepilin-type N-terminal cleavage/methylation domain-containing protein [uncultured Pseudoteredinibacter sp.]